MAATAKIAKMIWALAPVNQRRLWEQKEYKTHQAKDTACELSRDGEKKNYKIPHFSASQTEICIQLSTQCTWWQETVGSSAKIITIMSLLFPQQSLHHAKQ